MRSGAVERCAVAIVGIRKPNAPSGARKRDRHDRSERRFHGRFASRKSFRRRVRKVATDFLVIAK